MRRTGKDITICGYSRMALVAEQAAELLAQDGIEADVIDLRCLRPLDMETLVNSVKKTHHALMVEETTRLGGFAGELVSQIQEQAFDYLDAPVGPHRRRRSAYALLVPAGATRDTRCPTRGCRCPQGSEPAGIASVIATVEPIRVCTNK